MPYFFKRTVIALGLSAACTPGSLNLGEDSETASTGSTGPDIDTTGATPTTGEPTPEGVLEWNQRIDDVAGLDLAVAADGSIVVIGWSGYTYAGGDGGEFANTWVGKFDPTGALLWSVETPHESDTAQRTIRALAVAPGGAIYIAVERVTPVEGEGLSLHRLGPDDGAELWSRDLSDAPISMAARDDGVFLFGVASGINPTRAHAQALDAAGTPLWDRTFDDAPTQDSSLHAVAIDGETAVLTGNRGTPGQPLPWLLRVELATGATLWQRSLDGPAAFEHFSDVGLTADGDIVTMGWADGTVIRGFTAAGDDSWTHVPDPSHNLYAFAVASDGSFVLTDGLVPPEDDPATCYAPTSLCPVATRVFQHDPDRSPRWSSTRPECRSGTAATFTPDGGLLVLAECSDVPINDAAFGLLRFTP